MTRRYNHDSVYRALEHHVRTGALRSVASVGGDVSRPGSAKNFAVVLYDGDWATLNLGQANALALGLASAEKRWRPDASESLLETLEQVRRERAKR